MARFSWLLPTTSTLTTQFLVRKKKSKSIVTLKSIHAKIKARFRSDPTSALPFKTVSCYQLKQTEQFGADWLRKRADWKRLNICAKKKERKKTHIHTHPTPPSQRAASVWNKRKGKQGKETGARREPYLCRASLTREEGCGEKTPEGTQGALPVRWPVQGRLPT